MEHSPLFFGPWMMILVSLLIIIPVWRICSKAGYPGWISLAVLIPIGNILLLYFLGFATWPLERKASGTGTSTTSDR
jgi:hypothetical protein